MVTLMTWPLGLLRLAYLPSMAWGSLWLGSPLPMYASLWIRLINIRGLRRTKSKAREMVRLSPKREGISSRTAITITDIGGIFLGSLRLQFLKWLTLCSENWCIKFWRRPRTSHTSNGRTRWVETIRGATRVFITSTIRSRGIPLKTARLFGTIWSNWLGKKGYDSFCIIPTSRETNQGLGFKGMLL